MQRIVYPYCYQLAEPTVPPGSTVVDTAKTLGSLDKNSDWAEDMQCPNPVCKRKFWVGLTEESE